MEHFGEERAPLELTKVKKQTRIIVCPHCCGAITVGVQCAGLICKCNQYFSADDSLSEEQATHSNDTVKTINPDFIKLKADMEKKAYAYKEQVMDKRRTGEVRNHEPGFAEKKWGKDKDF
jgi:hypothetical protein